MSITLDPSRTRRVWNRRFGALVVLSAGLLSAAPATVLAQATAPITQGQKYVMATHSFNVFVGRSTRSGEAAPLDRLAAEAGRDGHESLAIQMIGGSTPMQHWNQGGEDESRNIAKAALRKGGVDVFTMSPNAIMPEEGIDLFGDLMIQTNPQGRILVQNSWSSYDGNGTTPAVGGSGAPGFRNEHRDDISIETIEGWINSLEVDGGYLPRMRAQLAGINQRAGREMAYVVPSAIAVYRLRQEVIRGHVPGFSKQSELFLDPIGHPAGPVANVVTYVWFAVMYRQSPVGLTALINPEDPTSAARERLLQQIAWNAAIGEPMSGVKGQPVALSVAH